MLLQVVLFQWLVIVLLIGLPVLGTIEPYLVLNYQNVNIHFDGSNFTRFYKCLCNVAMSYCVATTNTLSPPPKQVDVVKINQGYTGQYLNSPKKKCVVEKHGSSSIHFIINCTAETIQCGHQISLIPHNKEMNDSCRFSRIEMGFEDEVKVTQYDNSFIKVTYCNAKRNYSEEYEADSELMKNVTKLFTEESPHFRHDDKEHLRSQSVVGAEWDSNIKLLSSIGGPLMLALVLIAVFLITMRRKNYLNLPSVKGNSPTHKLKNSKDNTEHYQTIDSGGFSLTCVNQGTGIEFTSLHHVSSVCELDNPTDNCEHYQTIDSCRSSLKCVNQCVEIESISMLHIISANGTDDTGYSSIDIIDTYPVCSMQFSENCNVLQKMDSKTYNKKIEAHSSESISDKRVSSGQTQGQSTRSRSLKDLPKLPLFDDPYYTDGKSTEKFEPVPRQSHDMPTVLNFNLTSDKSLQEDYQLAKIQHLESEAAMIQHFGSLTSSSGDESYNTRPVYKSDKSSDCKNKGSNTVSMHLVANVNTQKSFTLEQNECDEVKNYLVNHKTSSRVIPSINHYESRFSMFKVPLRTSKNNYDRIVPSSPVAVTAMLADVQKKTKISDVQENTKISDVHEIAIRTTTVPCEMSTKLTPVPYETPTETTPVPCETSIKTHNPSSKCTLEVVQSKDEDNRRSLTIGNLNTASNSGYREKQSDLNIKGTQTSERYANATAGSLKIEANIYFHLEDVSD